MSQKQLKRLKVINSFIDGYITRKRAAELLTLSERQISRIAKELKLHGEKSLIHKNIGRKPVHAVKEEVKEAIISMIKKEEYNTVNFLHFKEILAEEYSIHLSYSALSSILKQSGFVSPKKKKRRKKHSRRDRKEHSGELLQIDASPFDWLSCGQMLSLHGAIDDATGKIYGLYLCANECLNGYFEVMRMGILNFGVPQTIYSDNHTIFRSPKTGKLTVEEQIAGKTVNLTQFGRAMHDLGIDMIFAKSAPAKGRIERLWETLQSRLVVEFKRRKIKTIQEANVFLSEYILLYNQRFSVDPAAESIFVPLLDTIDIDSILCVKQRRKTDNAGVFSFKNRTFLILDQGYPIVPKKAVIEVLISPRTGIRVQYKDYIFNTIKYLKPESVKKRPRFIKKTADSVMPHLKHSSDLWKNIWHSESFDLSLQFLYEIFFDRSA